MTLLARFDQRAGLMHQMMARLGVDVERAAFVALGTQLSSAARTCAFCRHVSECRAWLENGASDEAWRKFCPNAGRFERLRNIQLP